MYSSEHQESLSSDFIEFQELERSDSTNCFEETLLRFHQFVASGDLTSVQNICKSNYEYINRTDNTREYEDSALHIAARNGHLPVFAFLLSREKINITKNRHGHNALDVAIAANNTNIALHISRHSRWREFLHEKQAESEFTQLQQMVMKMPEVAQSFLDRCIEQIGEPESKDDFSIKYDFSILYDMPRNEELVCTGKLSDTLKTMVEEENIACLTHPVCLAYMKNEWHRIGFWMFLVNLVFYLVFLACLTSLTLLLQHRSIQTAPYTRIIRYMVVILCSAQLLKELIQFFHLKFQYFKEFENWLELILYTLSLSCVIFYGNYEDNRKTTQELRGTMAFSMFLAWAVLILYIRRSVSFGIYVIMMITIVTTLIKIVVLMLPFVCAYGIPFYVIFSIPELPPCETNLDLQNKECSNTTTPEPSKYLFESLPLSLWTTFMLLLGEMKYPHALYKYQPLPFPAETYLVYITFVLCMPIIIKNLMIGLSVGDVRRIKESARQKHILLQVGMLIDADNSLPNFILRWLHVSHVIEYPLRQESLTRKFMNIGFPDVTERGSVQKEKSEKIDLEQIGTTVTKLSAAMNRHEEKMNEMLNILQNIKSKITLERELTLKPLKI